VLLCGVIDYVTLTFDLWTPKQYHSKVIFYTMFEHFGIIHFWVILRTKDRQTDRQTDWLENPTHADRQSWCATLSFIVLSCNVLSCIFSRLIYTLKGMKQVKKYLVCLIAGQPCLSWWRCLSTIIGPAVVWPHGGLPGTLALITKYYPHYNRLHALLYSCYDCNLQHRVS